MNKSCPQPHQDICDARCEWFDKDDKTCIMVSLTKALKKLLVKK